MSTGISTSLSFKKLLLKTKVHLEKYSPHLSNHTQKMYSKVAHFYKWKTILVTWSTWFKWSWLAFWLHKMWAKVIGFGLPPATSPNLFSILELDKYISQVYGDINISDELNAVCETYKPEMIFHLAAQPLVKEGYKRPVYTFMTNAIGTVHILELIRQYDYIKGWVMITTDKVYENHEWMYPYRETDRLAGHDPYSASKAMAELAIRSYQQGFFHDNKKKVVSVRAGNVFGWGDWSADRLIPNIVRAQESELPLYINPISVRPWQHVIEPLYGYLLAWVKMFDDSSFIGAYNFGPDFSDNLTVKEIADISIELKWLTRYENYPEDMVGGHEARLLLLDNTKAKTLLHWYPRFSVREWLRLTFEWYNAHKEARDMSNITHNQIEHFITLLD